MAYGYPGGRNRRAGRGRGRGGGGGRSPGGGRETPLNKPINMIDDPGRNTGIQPRTKAHTRIDPDRYRADASALRARLEATAEKVKARTPDVTNREVMGGSARNARVRALRKRFYG